MGERDGDRYSSTRLRRRFAGEEPVSGAVATVLALSSVPRTAEQWERDDLIVAGELGVDRGAPGAREYLEAGLAERLEGLYLFVLNSFSQANLKNDPALIETSVTVLKELKEGWVALSKQGVTA